MKTTLKYSPKRGQWENSTRSLTVSHVFNRRYIESYLQAYSYNWYQLIRTHNGVIYLNTFNYSRTTASHIKACREFMFVSLLPYTSIEVPQGLQDDTAFFRAISALDVPINDTDTPQDVYEVRT